jgi:hypothetical protein|tara:strand:+ start:2124 stop:2465 length:342 start_codon:yes stop_codon:yes gene_type:complete
VKRLGEETVGHAALDSRFRDALGRVVRAHLGADSQPLEIRRHDEPVLSAHAKHRSSRAGEVAVERNQGTALSKLTCFGNNSADEHERVARGVELASTKVVVRRELPRGRSSAR